MDELAYYKLVDPVEWETVYNMAFRSIDYNGSEDNFIDNFIENPHRFDIKWFSKNSRIHLIEKFLLSVPCIYINEINILNSDEIVTVLSWLLDDLSKLRNLRIAAPRNLNEIHIQLVVNMLKSNYKVYINTFSVFGNGKDKWFIDTVNECNTRNVCGWSLVYQTVICLLCIAKYRLVRTGWINILPIIARFIHSARYEPVFYL